MSVPSRQLPPGDDIVTLLSHHKIPATQIARSASSRGIAHTILDTCHEVGAGLIIMAAYEHSKFTDDLLAGVTQEILDTATIPVLMSH